DIARTGRELLKIEQVRIEQMRRHGITQGSQHRSANVRNLFFEIGNQTLDTRAFQIWLRPAKVTRNNRKLCLRGELGDVTFAAVSQRTNNGVATVVRSQHRRHRFQPANVEQIQQEGRDDVI